MKLNSIRAQSALEYLMTYGWALVVMVVVIAALVSLDIFNLGSVSETCGGFNATLAYQAHVYKADGNFSLAMVNGTGKDINVIALEIDSISFAINPPVKISSGDRFVINKAGFNTGKLGSSYRKTVTMTYNLLDYASFDNLKTSGACLGKYQ